MDRNFFEKAARDVSDAINKVKFSVRWRQRRDLARMMRFACGIQSARVCFYVVSLQTTTALSNKCAG